MPDESKILRFRHLLEKHKLAAQVPTLINDLLRDKGLVLRAGTVVDATLIAAPRSTKNANGERDFDPASVVNALIKRLPASLRKAWPKTKTVVHAGSGFCRPRVLERQERWGVSYIIGLQKNSRLKQQVELAELALVEQYAAKQTKQRMFGEFEYAAGTWDKPRRVIPRLEHGEQGANPRFIVTDLADSAKALYERRECARGEAENRIKKAQLDLFGRRASCHRLQANQPRLLLAALAYTLMINLRRLALEGTELVQACTATIRTKPLARQNTPRILRSDPLIRTVCRW